MKSKILMPALTCIFLFGSMYTPLCAEDKEEESRILDIELLVEEFYSEQDDGETIEMDSNDDGTVDYLMRTSSKGEKSAEVLDYDHNGEMDDFYCYEKGVLISRAIDSNADGRIDIWVYLDEGVYVKRYERDVDYDGEIETVKDYEEEAKERAKKRRKK